MASKHTFTIKPIRYFVKRIKRDYPGKYLEPFCGYHGMGDIKNDLNPKIEADYHLESQELAQNICAKDFENIIFDPPYSNNQSKVCYESVGVKYDKNKMQQSVRFSSCKDVLSSKMRLGSVAVSFGWNSTGFGEKRGFKKLEILLVNHGSAHNDTICILEQKVSEQFLLFN